MSGVPCIWETRQSADILMSTSHSLERYIPEPRQYSMVSAL